MAHHTQIFSLAITLLVWAIVSLIFHNPLSLLNTMSFHGEGFLPVTRSFTKCNNFETPITKLWNKQLITSLYLRLCYMIPISIFSFYKWANRFVDAKNSLQIHLAGEWSAFVLKPRSYDAGHPALWLNCTSVQCLGLWHLTSLVQCQKSRLGCRVFKVPHLMVQVCIALWEWRCTCFQGENLGCENSSQLYSPVNCVQISSCSSALCVVPILCSWSSSEGRFHVMVTGLAWNLCVCFALGLRSVSHKDTPSLPSYCTEGFDVSAPFSALPAR